jgi:hypothetical protein
VVNGRSGIVTVMCASVAACAGLITSTPLKPLCQALGGSDACTEVSFKELDEPIPNPERGFFVFVDFGDDGDIEWAQGLERRLVNVRVVLSEYRDQALDEAKLSELRAGFARLRNAGLKAVLRFQYNEDSSGEDAPLAQVLEHIDQLGPTLRENSDVIAVLQAGFVGAWGEWHTSSNGLDSEQARASILAALLAALPTERMVQLRTPTYKETLLPGGPLAITEAYSGNDLARVGHHNDCLLASDSDNGTYQEPIDEWRAYVESDGLFTAVGGEACHYNERTDCAHVLDELERMHWSYLNSGYPSDVVGEWQSEGCYDEIDARLGYRFVLSRAAWSKSPQAGTSMRLILEIENQGFTAPFNERPIFAVLRSGDTRHDIRLEDIDPRSWLGGVASTATASVSLEGVEPGSYELSLWLPDAEEALRSRSVYSIRLANQDLWNPELGLNVLSTTVDILP